LPGPVGAAAAGIASPMMAAANPLTIVAANPSFFMLMSSPRCVAVVLSSQVSGLIPEADVLSG